MLKKEKTEQEPPISPTIALEELDEIVVEMISVLKKSGSLFSVGSLKNTTLTIELKELLLFVGITSKQVGKNVLFVWTEALNINKSGWPDETK